MTRSTVVRILGVFFVLVLATGVTANLLAEENNHQIKSDQACKLQGTWIGEVTPLGGSPVTFVSMYMGTGDNSGTEEVEWINMPPVLGYAYRGDQGVWTKSGPNKYDFTEIAFIVDDATDTVIMVQRASGTKVLTDCDTQEASAFLEYLDPETMQPIPGWSFPGPTATAKRLHVEHPE